MTDRKPDVSRQGLTISVPPVVRGKVEVLGRQQWAFSGTPAIIGLLGINGAGKSSFFLSLAGLLLSRKRPSVVLGGRTLSSVSFLLQHPTLPPWLSTNEVVGTFGTRFHQLEARFPGLILGEIEGQKVSLLSEGQLQALALALTLNADASITLLDEPVSALDLRRRRGLREHLAEWKIGATGEKVMVLSTQAVSDVVDYCDAMVVLHEGECRFWSMLEEMDPGPHADGLQALVEETVVGILDGQRATA